MPRPTKEQAEAKRAAALAAENAKIEARIQQMLPGLMAELTEKLINARLAAGTNEGVDKNSDRNLVESLATAIVKAGDPTNQGRLVDPKIMQQRAEAHERMVNLIMRFNAEGIMPVYTCRAKMYLDDVLIDPQWQDKGTKQFHDTMIRYSKIPNEGMVPHNDAAKQIHAEFLKSIGSIVEEGLPRAPWLVQDAPWIQTPEGIVQGRENVPIPELSEGNKGPYNDPRVGGHSPLPLTQPLPLFGKTANVKVEAA